LPGRLGLDGVPGWLGDVPEHDPGVVACGLMAVVAVCGGDRPDLDKHVRVSGGEPPGAVPAGRPGLTGSGGGNRCPTRRVVAVGFAPFHQSGAAMPDGVPFLVGHG